MKKATLFIIIFSISSLILINGCKKEPAASTPSSVTTIKGQVKAEQNLTIAGRENAPDGTKIIFLIDPNDLLNKPDTSKKYDSYRYTATVVSGQYSINIPARNNGSKVKIVADDFEAQYTFDNVSPSVRQIYSVSDATITVYAGTTTFHDINY